MVLSDNLLQSFAEIANQTAADTAGIHFGNVNTGILQKAAIDTNLTKLILDQYQLLTAVALRDHLLDQRCLTSAKEAGININFCHKTHLLYTNFLLYYTTFFIQCKENFITSTVSPCIHSKTGLLFLQADFPSATTAKPPLRSPTQRRLFLRHRDK